MGNELRQTLRVNGAIRVNNDHDFWWELTEVLTGEVQGEPFAPPLGLSALDDSNSDIAGDISRCIATIIGDQEDFDSRARCGFQRCQPMSKDDLLIMRRDDDDRARQILGVQRGSW